MRMSPWTTVVLSSVVIGGSIVGFLEVTGTTIHRHTHTKKTFMLNEGSFCLFACGETFSILL